MLVTPRNANRYGFRCHCCGHYKSASASRRKGNARARDAERRAIKRRERREVVAE